MIAIIEALALEESLNSSYIFIDIFRQLIVKLHIKGDYLNILDLVDVFSLGHFSYIDSLSNDYNKLIHFNVYYTNDTIVWNFHMS